MPFCVIQIRNRSRQPFLQFESDAINIELDHCNDFVWAVASHFSAATSFGREKGACDRAPEASADRSIFPRRFIRQG